MANHTEPDTTGGAAGKGGVATAPGAPGAGTQAHARGDLATQVAAHGEPYPPFHGRAVSWIAVSIVMAGFLVGAFAMVLGGHGTIWWLFWTGTGIAVLGLLVSVATNTFEDWY